MMNAIATAFSVMVMIFFGLAALMRGFEDLANAHMTAPANETVALTQDLIFPALSVIPAYGWLLFLAYGWLLFLMVLITVFSIVWRWW